MNMQKSLHRLVLGATLGCLPLAVDGRAVAAPDTIDVSKFPGAMIEDVVVPVASEVFLVLDKLGERNWGGELKVGDWPRYTDRTDLALLFGMVVAEGFIAVQAQDQQAVEDIGREVLNLARSLGIYNAVQQHGQSILSSANDGDWTAIRRELDRTQKTVRDVMREQRDEELAQCVSLGGWLRGTEAVASLVSKGYTHDKAEILNQPHLVEHFQRAIEKMPPRIRDKENLQAILTGLQEIETTMARNQEVLPVDGVNAVLGTCGRLVQRLYQTQP